MAMSVSMLLAPRGRLVPAAISTSYPAGSPLKFNKHNIKICCLAAPAPPPSGAAPSSGTPPPKEKPPNKLLKYVKSINDEFGEIEKFNKLFKSVEAYPIFINFIIGVITFVTNKENLFKIKDAAVKYRAYLGIAVLLMVGKVLSNRKGGNGGGAPSGKGSATEQQNYEDKEGRS